MTGNAVNADRLTPLVESVFDKSASESDVSELNTILLNNAVARRRFVKYCQMHVALRVELRANQAVQRAQQKIDAASVSSVSDRCSVGMETDPSLPTAQFFPTFVHSTFTHFSSGWPVAYLIATVVFGIGLVIGAFTYVSQPEHFADSTSPATRREVESAGTMHFVGRVTGMVDCKWVDDSAAAFNDSHVSLGRKYALSSGLMEITYDTGAKVILQGPVTYEVEAKNGGFLSIGRLTCKAEVEAANGFAVRTPTATVTDLGTEFGVEVTGTGITETHVFVGMVKLEGPSQADNALKRTLVAGQGVRIDTHAVISDASANSDRKFLRTMPVPKATASRDLIAEVDYSDTFTTGGGLPPRDLDYYYNGAADPTDTYYNVERACHGLPTVQWRRGNIFCFVNAAGTAEHDNSYPGSTGNSGADTGRARSSGGEWSIPYNGIRNDYIVQTDAIIPPNASISVCSFATTPPFWWAPGGLVVRFTRNTVSLVKSGDSPGWGVESSTGITAGIAANDRSWHNFAVRFNKAADTVSIYVNRSLRGTIDLKTFKKGIYKDYSSDAVGVGVTVGTSGLGWIDNFQVGSPSEDIVQENAATKGG